MVGSAQHLSQTVLGRLAGLSFLSHNNLPLASAKTTLSESHACHDSNASRHTIAKFYTAKSWMRMRAPHLPVGKRKAALHFAGCSLLVSQ